MGHGASQGVIGRATCAQGILGLNIEPLQNIWGHDPVINK